MRNIRLYKVFNQIAKIIILIMCQFIGSISFCHPQLNFVAQLPLL